MIYIYALHCPISGKPRYIGKSKKMVARLTVHLADARSLRTNHHCARWIRKLLASGLRPVMVIVRELPDGSDWKSAETETIRQYRAAGYKLTNMTAGGDGFHDVHPDVLKRRGRSLSKSRREPENNRRFREALIGTHSAEKHSRLTTEHWSDPANREQMVAAMRTPKAVKNRSKAAKKRYADPLEVAKHSAKMKEVCSTPEARKVASVRSTKAWSDPNKKKKRVEAMLARMAEPKARARAKRVILKINSRPEVKQKKSESLKANWADPDVRKKRDEAVNHDKMSESAKARWTDPEERAKILAQRKSPAHRFKLSQKAQARSTPKYRAMMAEKTRLSWERRKRKKDDGG